MREEPNTAAGHARDASTVVQTIAGSKVAMVITDPHSEDNPIVYVNQAFERVTGYSRSAAEGRNCRFLQGEDTDEKAVRKLRDGIAARDDVAIDLLNYRADGTSFTNRLMVSPVFDDAGGLVYFLGVQKQIDDGLLDEESDLSKQLTEVQHRVKNHLSMIIGLIRLQSRKSQSREEFAALARRVESLQMLYEEMSGSNAMGGNETIRLGAYLTRVASAISYIDGRAGIRVVIDVAQVQAPLDAATRLGLTLSEVMTNCYQHAFEGLDSGLVEVRMIEFAEGGVRLTIADDGVGIPEGTEWPSRRSLGGQIIAGLVEGLQGSIDVTRGAAGTVVNIEVPGGIWSSNED
ncbi:MAG: PAS domain-containing protein [Shimia sp.]